MQENFYIDEWLIQPEINRISRNGEEWKLEPKIMAVLCSLAQKPAEVVSRDELFATVWKDTVVVDMALTRAISELRSVFKDVPTQPRVIETIPKGGYRLIASVREAPSKARPIKAGIPSVSIDVHQWKYAFITAFLLVSALITFLAAGNAGNSLPKIYNIKPLTAMKGWEFHPDLSPDGSAVAFVWRKPGENQNHLCIKSLDRMEHKVITSDTAIYLQPRWSPDANQLAYYKNDQGKVTINLISAYGGAERTLIEANAQIAALSWSPDGAELAYIDLDTTNNQHAVFIYSLEMATSTQVTRPKDNFWGDSSPEFSPDGKKLAFARILAEGIQDLYLLNLASGEEKLLTETKSAIYGFDWSDNETLIMSSDFGGQVSLWSIDISNDGELTKLQLGRNHQNPSIQNGKLVVEDWETDTDLVKIDLNQRGQNVTPLAESSTLWELHPDISANGKKILFSSNQSGNYEIWSANRNGTNQRQLTQLNRSFTANPKWAPKGDVLAFDSKIDGYSHIYLIDSNGVDQYQFTKGHFHNMTPTWSANGESIYFTSDRSGSWEIWRKPLNGNKAVQITKNGGYYALESPEGQMLYYAKHRQDGIWQKELETGKERKLTAELSFQDWGNWTVAKNSIYFVNRTTTPDEISRLSLSTDSLEAHYPFRGSIPAQDIALSVAPDESWALLGYIKGYGGDLVYIDNL
ncbi:MAG: hypothetical protein HEP71_03750 [Roseivirga sp.]|nr:hypothetical protein [Roseivirga sp.]